MGSWDLPGEHGERQEKRKPSPLFLVCYILFGNFSRSSAVGTSDTRDTGSPVLAIAARKCNAEIIRDVSARGASSIPPPSGQRYVELFGARFAWE